MSNYIFNITQGTTFERRFEYYTGNPATPFDFTDYDIRAEIKSGYGTSATTFCSLSSSRSLDGTGINMNPISASVTLPKSSGSFSMYISAYSSSLFNFDTGIINIDFVSGSGVNQYVGELLTSKVKLYKR